jgi:hypothetical protein
MAPSEGATYLAPVVREPETPRTPTDYIGASLLLTREEWAGTLDPDVWIRAKLTHALRSMRELAREGWGPPGPKGDA